MKANNYAMGWDGRAPQQGEKGGGMILYVLMSVDSYDDIPAINGIFDSLDNLNKHFTEKWFDFHHDFEGKVFTNKITCLETRDRHGYLFMTYYEVKYLNEIEGLKEQEI